MCTGWGLRGIGVADYIRSDEYSFVLTGTKHALNTNQQIIVKSLGTIYSPWYIVHFKAHSGEKKETLSKINKILQLILAFFYEGRR